MRRKLFLAAILALSTAILRAASIYGARIEMSPAEPYAGEEFDLLLHVETSQGCTIDDFSFYGLPPTNMFTCGVFSRLQVKSRSTADGQTIFLHSFRTRARALSAMDVKLDAVASITVSSRIGTQFFTQMRRFTRDVPLLWPRLTVRPLPQAGRPEDFHGAVGSFSLKYIAEPSEVMPGDLVTLTLTVSGNGFLDGALPVLPTLEPRQFKTYAPKIERDLADGLFLRITQVAIPQSTQALHIASAHMSYFDPSAGEYRVARSEPIALTFCERKKSMEPAVREVILGDGTNTSKTVETPGKSDVAQIELRVAPAASAMLCGKIRLDESVRLVERYGAWVRVCAGARAGWVTEASLESKPAQ